MSTGSWARQIHEHKQAARREAERRGAREMAKALRQAVEKAKMAGSMPRPSADPNPDTYLGRIAMRLKALREAAGLDHDKAAAAITRAGYKVATSTVYRWEQGRTQPHLEALPAIAAAYGVTARVVLPPS